MATLTTNGATAGVGSIYQSTDSGTTWSRTDVDQGIVVVNDLVVDLGLPHTLYLASSFNGMFKSTNGGAAWASENAGLPGASPSMFSLAIDPTATTILYAAGIAGGRSSVFKSTDGGAAWQRLNVASAACDLRAVVIVPSAPQTLFVGGGCNVFKSQAGAPTSNATVDPNNHTFIYMRWQRGVMHYDATCNCTQGILLADYLKAIVTGQNLPADVAQEAASSPFRDKYDPSAPNWVRDPSVLPNTDLTNAFTPE